MEGDEKWEDLVNIFFENADETYVVHPIAVYYDNWFLAFSEMIGTSVKYWRNLQNAYDALIAEFKLQEERNWKLQSLN